MRRVQFATLIAMVAGMALSAAGQQSYRSGTNSVSIYATVLDNAGRLVPNLTRDDFEVYDDGVKQDVTLFDNSLQPITIVIMLDRSGSMVRNFDLVRHGAEQFVSRLLPADRARLGSFANRIQLDPETFTGDRAALLRILHDDLQDAGATPLWNATAVAMTALGRESGRRVVLLFSDGYDSPERPNGNISSDEVRRRSQTEEVMVYGIGFSDDCAPFETGSLANPAAPLALQRGGRGAPRTPAGIPGRIGGRGPLPIPIPPIGDGRIGRPSGGDGPIKDPVGKTSGPDGYPCKATRPDRDLRTLAAVGGGGYFELRRTDDLGATFARVADELHHQYLLAFSVTKLDGRMHALDVRLKSSALTIRTRRSYLAGAQ